MKKNIATATLAILALSIFATAASAADSGGNGGFCRSIDSGHQAQVCGGKAIK